MSIGPGYVCVGCKTYLRPRKDDIVVLVEMEDGRPYQLWSADLWECPDCGAQVVLGYGQHQWAEHYELDFEEQLQKARARGVVVTVRGPLKPLS